MSKKSRRRNKKILGALGALGALAMLGGRKKPVSTKTTIMDNMPKNDIEFKETVISAPMKKPVVKSVPVGRMRGTGSDEAAIAGQNKRAAYAQSMRAPKNVMGPFDYMQPRRSSIMAKPGLNRMSDDMGFKKGGRVGCGKAKRGFGRALKKRRK
jgi:hypothetical protein|tara:strand:+ start:413 stop:874 length:462 start_codon:yes stop_codon:yes gene_type:complete